MFGPSKYNILIFHISFIFCIYFISTITTRKSAAVRILTCFNTPKCVCDGLLIPIYKH